VAREARLCRAELSYSTAASDWLTAGNFHVFPHLISRCDLLVLTDALKPLLWHLQMLRVDTSMRVRC
jgi:hypothetical protein